jgi:S1-C subfamily serine protease
MDLTPEQKARIFEEEQQRLAEEQYRAQVRRELGNQTATAPSNPATISTAIRTKSNSSRKIAAFVGVVLGLCAIYLLIGNLWHVVESKQPGEAPAATAAVSDQKPAAKATVALNTAPEAPIKLTTEQIAEAAKPSVVVIRSVGPDSQPIGQGSGYIYASEGIVVTNYHVIRGASQVRIQTPSKGELQVTAILAYNPEHDVAALAVAEENLPMLNSEFVVRGNVGERVVAIGAPLGLDQTVTEGIISARRIMGGLELIQTSAAISPGSSGGPLIDEYGRVIGLNTQKQIGGENLNFAVPVRYISELLAQQHRISFADMLDETHVVNRFPGNSLTVQPRQLAWFNFTVSARTGATLAGTFEISGGNRDVGVSLNSVNGERLASFGRMTSEGRISQHLSPGQYRLVFDNSFSLITAKSVTPDLALEYYK